MISQEILIACRNYSELKIVELKEINKNRVPSSAPNGKFTKKSGNAANSVLFYQQVNKSKSKTLITGQAMFSVFNNEREVIQKLQQLIETIANESIASDRGRFFIGFSGGSLGNYLCQILPNIKTDWTKWKVYFCDERYVPENDVESTFG